MRFRPWLVATYPLQQQQQQISGHIPALTVPEYRPLPPQCQAPGRWGGGFFRRCRVLRNSMETRGFFHAGLNACESIPKRPFPNPSGKRKQSPQLDRAKSSIRIRSGFSGACPPPKAGYLREDEAAAVGAEPGLDREPGGSTACFQVHLARRIGLPRRQPPPRTDHREQGGREASPRRQERPGRRKCAAADWRMRARLRAGKRRARGERR